MTDPRPTQDTYQPNPGATAMNSEFTWAQQPQPHREMAPYQPAQPHLPTQHPKANNPIAWIVVILALAIPLTLGTLDIVSGHLYDASTVVKIVAMMMTIILTWCGIGTITWLILNHSKKNS